MSNKQINELARQMAEMMTGIIEKNAQERVREIVDSAFSAQGQAPRVARTSVPAPSRATGGTKKKRNYQRKPCPVPECDKLAAPRHSMVCIDHKDLSQREKDQYKAMASAPGGKWYKEKRERDAGKRKAAAAA